MKLSNLLKMAARFSGGKRPPPPPAPRPIRSSSTTYRMVKLLWAALVTGLLVGTSTVQILWPTSPWLDVLQEMKEATGIEPETHPRTAAPAVAPQGPAPQRSADQPNR